MGTTPVYRRCRTGATPDGNCLRFRHLGRANQVLLLFHRLRAYGYEWHGTVGVKDGYYANLLRNRDAPRAILSWRTHDPLRQARRTSDVVSKYRRSPRLCQRLKGVRLIPALDLKPCQKSCSEELHRHLQVFGIPHARPPK